MRVLIFQFGTQGDVRPLLAIGAGLRARDHEVVVHVNPRFERMVRAEDVPFEPVGTVEEYTAVLDNPDLWHPRHGPRLLQDAVFATPLARQLEVVARDKPDLVVAGTFAVGAQLACEKHTIPFARVHGQPSVFFGAHDPPVLPSGRKPGGPLWWRRAFIGLLDKTLMRATVGKALNAVRGELGLPLWKRDFMGSYVAADLNVCLFPSWFAAPTPDWPDGARQFGFPIEPSSEEVSAELSAFLEGGEPPLVFTPGPAGYQHSDEFFVEAADACTRLGRRAVFVTRGLELRTPAPDLVHVCDYAPFHRLFPAASLVVHHGGIGTVAHGLAAGRPQLVTPFGFDQPDNAWRLQALGVGAALPRSRLGGAALAEAIAALDVSATRDACRVAQEKMAADAGGVAGAVAEIEALGASTRAG